MREQNVPLGFDERTLFTSTLHHSKVAEPLASEILSGGDDMRCVRSWTIRVLAIFLFSIAAYGHGGSEVGSGGDAYAQAFVTRAYELLARLSSRPLQNVDNARLASLIVKAKVNSEESLFLQGLEVGAINYPHPENPRIIMSRKMWDRFQNDPYRQSILVLHEYLNLMGIDDRNYQVSQEIDQAKVCSRTPAIRDQIEKYFQGISCDRIGRDDLARVKKFEQPWQWKAQIEYFKDHDFAFLYSLENISFEGLGIKRIQPGLFSDLKSFSKSSYDSELLWLKENALTRIEAGAFRGLQGISHLLLDDNQISLIEPGALQDVDSIAALGLNNNKLTELRVDVLKGLSNLESLNARGNQISKFPLEALQQLPNLEYLELSDNKMSGLPRLGEFGFQKLHRIDFGGNRTHLRAFHFANLPALDSVQLHRTIIDSIEPNALAGFTGGQYQSLYVSPSYVTNGIWRAGMFKGAAKLWALSACDIVEGETDENLAKKIEPGAFDGVEATYISLCTELTPNSAQPLITDRIFRGVRGHEMTFVARNLRLLDSFVFSDLKEFQGINIADTQDPDAAEKFKPYFEAMGFDCARKRIHPSTSSRYGDKTPYKSFVGLRCVKKSETVPDPQESDEEETIKDDEIEARRR